MKNNLGIVARSECPVCHYVFDCASAMRGNATPQLGDLSLCIECGELLVFTADLSVRLADLNDALKLDKQSNQDVDRAQRLIRGRLWK